MIFLLLFFTFTTFIDFTSWTAIFIVLLSIILTFAAVWTASLEFFHFKQTEIFYSIIVVIVLSLGLLINIQIIFNEAIFELCPNDYIFGSLLIFSDIMWVFHTFFLDDERRSVESYFHIKRIFFFLTSESWWCVVWSYLVLILTNAANAAISNINLFQFSAIFKLQKFVFFFFGIRKFK